MTRRLTLYPAIDLKAGACVRLMQGRMEDATVYNRDPGAQGVEFEKMGFDWVHIVDLDGAFTGQPENASAVSDILRDTGLKAQLGGGLRDLDAVEQWLSAGITRAILGTAAVKDAGFVAEACKKHPNRIVVGIDARDGRVKTDGWDGDSGHTPAEIVKRYEDQGVAAIIYTDISRDGVLKGVNIDATAGLADTAAIPIIASGGVASLGDIQGLRAAHENIEGVIIGRALYEGRIDPVEALAVAVGKV